jgi:hypothetical protein
VNARALVKQLSVARLVVGATFIAQPGRAAAGWIGADGQRPAVHVLARAFGARDALVGGGTLQALKSGDPDALRPWLVAGIVADVTDLAATLLAGDSIPAGARLGISIVASSAVAVGAAALASGDDSSPVPA